MFFSTQLLVTFEKISVLKRTGPVFQSGRAENVCLLVMHSFLGVGLGVHLLLCFLIKLGHYISTFQNNICQHLQWDIIIFKRKDIMNNL